MNWTIFSSLNFAPKGSFWSSNNFKFYWLPTINYHSDNGCVRPNTLFVFLLANILSTENFNRELFRLTLSVNFSYFKWFFRVKRADNMINESSYIEIMKNCSKWNSRILSERKRSSRVLNQQTGVLERPNPWLYPTYQDRYPPSNPQQVVFLKNICREKI